MSITAALVKDLRTATGAGMMDCKKALLKPVATLKLQSIGSARKAFLLRLKSPSRVASEGLVGVAASGTVGTLVEVNSDNFVARNEEFQTFVSTLANLAADASDIEALAAMDYPGTGRNVTEELTDKIATIGENMSLRRMEKLSVNEGAVISYIHKRCC